MNTAIAAIEEDINGAAPRNVVFSDTERIGVSHGRISFNGRRCDSPRPCGLP